MPNTRDRSRGQEEKKLTHKICNARNILGAASFASLIAAPAAAEGGMYLTSALLAGCVICACLSIREDGHK